MTNVAARERANNELGDWILKRKDELISKGFTPDQAIEKLGNQIDKWTDENESIIYAKKTGSKYAKLRGGDDIPNPKFAKNIEGQKNMSDRLTGAKFVGVDGRVIETKGAQLSPLDIDDEAIKAMDQHHRTGLPVNVKGMTAAQGGVGLKTLDASMPTMTGLIPAQLLSGIIERVWPYRIADDLASIGGDLAQFTYIKDTTTAAAQAAVVGEGQTKPTVDVALTAVTDPYVKIAGKAIFTREQSDYPAAFSYLINQLQKNVISAENHQILYGDGSTNSDGSVNMIVASPRY
jgi:HK97 family phage major capsid protein